MFYTYSHKKPDGSVFYIGKGIGNRAYEKDGRNIYWQRIVAKYGYEVEIIAEWELEEDAFAHERYLISILKEKGVRLVNLTNGGEGSGGYRWTDEQKARFDISGEKNGMFGKRHSEETRKKIADKAKGRILSEETKAKISKAHKGRVFSAETIEKLRVSSSSRKHSEETKRKLSELKSGKKLSQEHRDKIAKGGTGRRNTPETLEKMRISALLRHERDRNKKY